MNDLILYFVRSGFSFATLYIFYWVFLKKETCFSCNRFYLIFSLLFSALVPFIPNMVEANNLISLKYSVLLEPITIFPENQISGENQNFNIFQILLWIYISGVILNILRLFIQLSQLILLAGKTGIHREYGVKVVYTGKPYTNFSFFDIIFLNNQENDKNQVLEIITHEKVHIRQKHFIDLIIIELMTTIFWFNPFIWFYKHSVKAIHEYLADEGVLKNGYKKTDYQELLLNQTFGIQFFALTNNLNQSLIKRRLTMMSKSRTNKFAILKIITAIPLAAVLIILFSFSISNTTIAQEKVKTVKKSDQKVIKTKEVETFVVVEQMPNYPGGEKAMFKFIGENIKYPEEARKQGISGRVYVTFVVEDDGEITDIKLLRGIGGGCDEEA
ncbi:MAG: TonB family protein, partial [Bacteroidales bacterium]|nr:TonB family protein [Bacteroidales bacterium]